MPEDDYETMEEYVEEQNDTSDIPPEAYDPSDVVPESEEEYVNENAQTVENHMNGSFEVPPKEKNSTISDKNGENSTKVKEPIIPYSVLKDNGITFNLDKGDDR